MSVGFVAALGVWLCRWSALGAPFPVSRANLPLTILLALTAIGFAISPAPDLAVITAAQVVAGVTVFFVALDRLQTPEDLWRGAMVLVVLGVGFAVIAPFTANWGSEKLFGLTDFYKQWEPRLPKTTNTNILAGALAPIVPIALALALRRERWSRALGAIALAPLIAITILLQSRGALFALALGVAVWAMLYRPALFALIPLAAVGAWYANSGAEIWGVSAWIHDAISTPVPGTFLMRQDIWAQSIHLIRESPWVGVGLNAYVRIAPTAWPHTPATPGIAPTHAHNLLLQVALDTGVCGVAAFATLLLYAWRATWRAYRADAEKHLAIGVLAAFVVVLAHGLGDVAMWGTAKSSVVLWLLLALAFGNAASQK